MNRTVTLYADAVEPGYVSLVDFLGNEITIVNAARVSFNREIETLLSHDKRLIKYLITHKHTSTLEHNVVTFKFKVPLFVARQHMRHRTWSFNEISRRYTSDDLSFYLPCKFRKQAKTNRQGSVAGSEHNPVLERVSGSLMDHTCRADESLRIHIQNSLKLYNQMLSNDICREQARMVLPQNLYTTYIGTVNLNNLIKFLKLRAHEGAQQEIQELAQAIKILLNQIWPETMKIIEGECF